jgi:hypothetical protein
MFLGSALDWTSGVKIFVSIAYRNTTIPFMKVTEKEHGAMD